MTDKRASEILYNQWQSFLENNLDYGGVSEAYKKAFKLLEQEPCDNAISRNDMLDAIGHGTIYTSEKLQKIIKGLPDVKTIGIQDSMLIPTIKSELDNLDTYTIHMGASQTDKVCVEFKEVVKLLEKYRMEWEDADSD